MRLLFFLIVKNFLICIKISESVALFIRREHCKRDFCIEFSRWCRLSAAKAKEARNLT